MYTFLIIIRKIKSLVFESDLINKYCKPIKLKLNIITATN